MLFEARSLVGSLLLLGVLVPTPTSTVQESGDGPVHPLPSEVVTVPAEGLSLWAFLGELSEATGSSFLPSSAAKAALDDHRITLSKDMAVSPEAWWSVAEAFVAEVGCVLSVVRESEPRIVTIQLAEVSRGKRLHHVRVDVDRINAYAEHPALLIETLVPLPHLDARNASNSLRTIVLDQSQLTLVPVGKSPSILVRGVASEVYRMVKTLQQADRLEEELQALEEPAEEAAEVKES